MKSFFAPFMDWALKYALYFQLWRERRKLKKIAAELIQKDSEAEWDMIEDDVFKDAPTGQDKTEELLRRFQRPYL